MTFSIKRLLGRQIPLLCTIGLIVCMANCPFGDSVCSAYDGPVSGPLPLGTHSDLFFQTMEENAEISDFVLYQHEFNNEGPTLNQVGADHLKQIAMRLNCKQDLPVVIERCMTGVDPESEYQFPVNPDPKLDNQRRELIVRSLTAMGVVNAGDRVLVAGAYSDGMEASEASSVYQRGFNTSSRSINAWGGGNNMGSMGGGGFGPYGGW